MSQREKLLEKLRASPRNVTFKELEALLMAYDYKLVRVSGSHHIYGRPGYTPVNITFHPSKVALGAVKDVVRAVDEVIDNE
jgi:predicted RNA binding protein YcfA (HicA-like mRNA interferase family)